MDLTLSRQIQHTCALVSLLFQTLNHLAQPREFIRENRRRREILPHTDPRI